jgi:hypothetical protein
VIFQNSYLCTAVKFSYLHSGVIDTAAANMKVTAVSLTPLCKYESHSGVIDTAVTKLGEYKVDLLREY